MHILLMSDATDVVAGVLMPASFYQLNFATVRKWWCLSDLHHSQGGVDPNNNYMSPRGEYISRPPCNRVTLQMGMPYPSTNQVTREAICFFGYELTALV